MDCKSKRSESIKAPQNLDNRQCGISYDQRQNTNYIKVMKVFLSLALLSVLASTAIQVLAKDHEVISPQRSFVQLPKVSQTQNAVISPAYIDVFQNCSGRWDTYCYDCNHVVICAGKEEPLYQGECPPSAPYCDGNMGGQRGCVVNLDFPEMEESCDIMRSGPRCTTTGYIPDVNDARVYYYCRSPGDTIPPKYTCPVDTMFDTVTHNCKRVVPFDCTGKENQYVLHPLHSAYYAFCRVNGISREIIAYRCRDDQNFVFNLESQACEYQCKEEGVFVDREDCFHYYECVRSGNSFSHRRVECAYSGEFNKEKGACTYHYNCYPELGW
ncbi:hypothetical protein DMENIID0001_043990 [Sergentomyia squamirostris]